MRQARLLAAAVRADAPGSELAAGLDKFASSPVVTRETVEKLASVMETTAKVAPEPRAAELTDAKRAVDRACRTIDTPEQRAQDAVDQAIRMLAAGEYRAMLERFTEPRVLERMRREGRQDAVARRFADGWGATLLSKLKLARTTVPEVNADGTITFVIPGVQGPTTHPVTMVKVGKRWYFRE